MNNDLIDKITADLKRLKPAANNQDDKPVRVVTFRLDRRKPKEAAARQALEELEAQALQQAGGKMTREIITAILAEKAGRGLQLPAAAGPDDLIETIRGMLENHTATLLEALRESGVDLRPAGINPDDSETESAWASNFSAALYDRNNAALGGE